MMAGRTPNLDSLPPKACCSPITTQRRAARRGAPLQLKWKHQFQFAGYYAALEQGFYQNTGLDVTIREGGRGRTLMDTPGSDTPAAGTRVC
jgi:ABC-type nitrate/sulfonate/bicarbonate transport system substrate-binding protein